LLSIGEVAERTGINASALRYYEQVGLIPKPARSNGQRKYSCEVIGRIEIIKLAQKSGFQIPEIHFLLQGFDSNIPPSERWRSMANLKRMELETKRSQIDSMIQVLDNSLQCRCLSWDECFHNIQIID
jgi:MerR family redox-sensitive transcriptional activator SoxR